MALAAALAAARAAARAVVVKVVARAVAMEAEATAGVRAVVRGEEVRAAARAVASAADWEADFVERAQRPARGGRGRKGVWTKSGVAFPAPGALKIRLKSEYACAPPPSKSAPPKGAYAKRTNQVSFDPFRRAQILGAFTTPSLVAACYPLAFGDCVRWRERLRVRLRVRLCKCSCGRGHHG